MSGVRSLKSRWVKAVGDSRDFKSSSVGRTASPLNWAVAQVELAERGGEATLEQYLAKVLAPGPFGHLGIALDPLPAHRLELLAERALDESVFPLDFAHVQSGNSFST